MPEAVPYARRVRQGVEDPALVGVEHAPAVAATMQEVPAVEHTQADPPVEAVASAMQQAPTVETPEPTPQIETVAGGGGGEPARAPVGVGPPAQPEKGGVGGRGKCG